jgi:hypothetical protein
MRHAPDPARPETWKYVMSTGKHIFTVTSWNETGELSRSAYRAGYKKAADVLVLKLLSSDTDYIADLHMRFGMIYPIMFLYRHYVEIEFKDLIILAGMTSVVEANKICGHDLHALWSKVLVCAEEVQGEDMRQELEGTFGEAIEFFQRVDPYGDGFRYPKNVKGAAQWDSSFYVDIEKINSAIECLEQFCHELRQELRQRLDPEAEDISGRDYFY